jgi:hypothetical protein
VGGHGFEVGAALPARVGEEDVPVLPVRAVDEGDARLVPRGDSASGGQQAGRSAGPAATTVPVVSPYGVPGSV